MKAHLLYRDRDFDWRWALQAAAVGEAQRTGRRYESQNFDRRSGLPWNDDALSKDLELNTLFAAMAGDDDWAFEVARKVILTGPQNDIATIRYRQDILQDCLNHPAVIRQLYAIAVEAMEKGKRHYLGTLARYPHYVLRDAIEFMESMLGVLRKLRIVADSDGHKFAADGWVIFFSMVKQELGDEYLTSVQHHLRELRFRRGVLLSAKVGKSNKAAGYVLHRPPALTPWLTRLLEPLLRLFTEPGPPVYSFSLHPRDESGARILSELQDRGIGHAASALGQSADHVRSFFTMLRAELAFYVGCVNLHEQLVRNGEPVCMPVPEPAESRQLSCRGLYDVCLSLHMRRRVVGNDAENEPACAGGAARERARWAVAVVIS